MKILNIEIPDEMMTSIVKRNSWHIAGYFELDQSWIGGRVAQINPVMAQAIQSASEPDLQKKDHFFVQYIEQLIANFDDPQLAKTEKSRMKEELLGSLRTLYVIRCRLASADRPRTMALLDVLKEVAYDVFASNFHPDEWDRVSEQYDEALARVLPSEDLETIEYALRLAIGDAHSTACRTRRLGERKSEIARRDADYERVLAVYRRFTGFSAAMEGAHVQSDPSSTRG